MRITANIVCPTIHDLSLALKIRLTIRPAITAAVIPPAVALSPPVRIPMKPSCWTASLTPFARQCPKPVKGTVAPAPANSAIGL